jgi:hypothetical protein
MWSSSPLWRLVRFSKLKACLAYVASFFGRRASVIPQQWTRFAPRCGNN